MSASGRELCSGRAGAALTTPTTSAAPRGARGRKRLQSNAEETVPKCSKTDTAQDHPNSDNDDNEDEGGDDKPKKAPAKAKGKGPARVKKTRCVALPFPPCIS